MGDSSEFHGKLDDSAAVKLTGKIMVAGIVLLFFVVVFVLFLHLYAKWFWYRQGPAPAPAPNTQHRRRRRRFDFAPGYQELAANALGHRRGLDPSVLKSLPVTVFDPSEFKEGLECAVCLSDLAAGEKARLLPECNHGFHLECIDMWFQSHSTCPLCRNPVANQPSNLPEITIDAINPPSTENHQAAIGVYQTESLSFPTNVLFWGNQVQVSTMGSSAMEEELRVPSTSFPPSPSSSSSSSPPSPSSTSASNRPDGFLVIDIPRQIAEEEEPKTPAPTRLRSLKRLLSRDRRVNPSSSSADVEQQQQQSRGQS